MLDEVQWDASAPPFVSHGIGELLRDDRMSNPVSSSRLTIDSQQLAIEWPIKIHA
jgi:hypothetical protein